MKRILIIIALAITMLIVVTGIALYLSGFYTVYKSNWSDLTELPPDTKVLAQNYEENRSELLKAVKSIPDSELSAEVQTPIKVDLHEEVLQLFDPAKTDCPIPNGIKDKMAGWMPKEVLAQLEELRDRGVVMVDKYPTFPLEELMHRVEVGNMKEVYIVPSPTRDSMILDKYMLNRDRFLYTLDCSGYLNATMGGEVNLLFVRIKASAKSSLDKNRSMFVAYGQLVSPIVAAFYDYEVKLSKEERMGILESLLRLPISDDELIYTPTVFHGVWGSRTGSGSRNGEASIGANTEGKASKGSITIGTKAGASVSMSSSYSTYYTYSTGELFENPFPPFTLSQVRKLLQELKN